MRHAWQAIQLQLHSEDSRTCEASLEKSKVAQPWSTGNLDHPKPGIWLVGDMVNFAGTIPPTSEMDWNYLQVEVMPKGFHFKEMKCSKFQTTKQWKDNLCEASFLSLGATQLYKKKLWTYVKIKVIQSYEVFLNLSVCTTISPILWLMDPWNEIVVCSSTSILSILRRSDLRTHDSVS